MMIAAMFMTGDISYAQLYNAMENVVDGDFGSTTHVISTSIPEDITSPNDLDATGIDYFSNIGPPILASEVIFNGSVFHSPSVVSSTFCIVQRKIDENAELDDRQELVFYAKDLVLGNFYDVNITAAAIYNANTNPDFNKVRFDVYVGDEVYRTASDILPPSSSGAPTWHALGVQFCPTSTVEKITIVPVFVNVDPGNPNHVIMALDGVGVYIQEGKFCDYSSPPPCVDCTSLELVREEHYVISGWIKQTNLDNSQLDTYTYQDAAIEVKFSNSSNADLVPVNTFTPSGEIIDGWQKITGEFVVPIDAGNVFVSLNNYSTVNSYFDDIRVHPVNSSLKSFVYDQDTNKLMAELDENNYATFYEYDKEGSLVRVKKETEKGVFTIQETRSSNIKSGE